MEKVEKSERLDPDVLDRLLDMLREGKTRYEIEEELGVPYHTRKLIPPERMKDYYRACMVGRAKRYRQRLMGVPVKCPNCGTIIKGGRNEQEGANE